MFEKAKENTGREVNSMLARLEDRVNSKKIDKETTEQAVAKVTGGIVKAKEIINSSFDFEHADKRSIAELTNAWSAWRVDGILKGDTNKKMRIGLQELLTEEGDASPAVKRYARQVWRTEMVSFIAQKLSNSHRTDRAEVMESVLSAQKVTEAEDEPMEALTTGFRLDPKLRDRQKRLEIAGKMKKAKNSSDLANVPTLFTGFQVREIKVLVGGEFIAVSFYLAAKLRFKNNSSKIKNCFTRSTCNVSC